MALDTEPAPTTPPAGISPDNLFSSPVRTLVVVGLLTIFTLAITAVVKIVAIYVIKKFRQLFRRPAVSEAGQAADHVEIPEAGQAADPVEIPEAGQAADPVDDKLIIDVLVNKEIDGPSS